MPLPLTHGLLSVFGVELFQKLRKKQIPVKHVLWWAFLAGIVADADFGLTAIQFFTGWNLPWWLVHRSLTHTFLFPILFLAVGFILWHTCKKKTYAIISWIAAWGIGLHLITDFFFSGAHDLTAWLWPLYPGQFSLYFMHTSSSFFLLLDVVFLALWLVYLIVKEKRKRKLKWCLLLQRLKSLLSQWLNWKEWECLPLWSFPIPAFQCTE